MKSGKKLWADPVAAQSLLVSDNVVVYLKQDPAPVEKQEIIARDLKTGKELWRVAHSDFEASPTLFLAGVGEGVVALSRHKPGSTQYSLRCDQIICLSLKNGKKLWQADGRGDAMVLFKDGKMWYGNKSFDPQSGSELGLSPINSERHMCVPPVVVGNYAGTPRSPQWTDLSKKTTVSASGLRGGCVQGIAVSDGRMYMAQNFCRCSPGQLPGFLALGSGEPLNAQNFKAKRTVVKGSGTADKKSVMAEHAWPSFRGNKERSSAVTFDLGTKLSKKWQTVCAADSDAHPIAGLWKDNLQEALTALVINNDMVLVSARNHGTVYALNAKNGKVLWTAQCASRLDAPPSISHGLALVSSHDGWVYAFALSDGALVYKTMIAPQEKRMMSFASIESMWPVIGSPLIHGDNAYVLAGRSTDAAGGCTIVAFDIASGETKWAKQMAGGMSRCADILQWRNDALYVQGRSINAETGLIAFAPKAKTANKIQSNLAGMLDDTWIYVGNRRSGSMPAGNLVGDIVVWTDDMWFGYDQHHQRKGSFAITKAAASTVDIKNPDANAFVWCKVAKDLKVTSMVVANNCVVIAGILNNAGCIRVLNIKTGAVISEVKLSSPVIANGIAVTDTYLTASLRDGNVVCFEHK
ncbi:MAG: PQQ-binding-like beta-propeller repeat protein [Planctomycetes bacterium]|nr:PQQ-binding-like beta-propeller repeat protein [Planctomycetota bacterium]